MFLARGSSDNAAVFGRYLVELRSGRPAGLMAPSLYTRYHAAVDWSGFLVVALSQSGATPEIVRTCADLRASGAVVIGLTNLPGSPLAEVVDRELLASAGPERAVPATKTVTAQLALLVTVTSALSAALPRRSGGAGELAGLPDAVAAVLDDPGPARNLAARWQGLDRLVVAGRGLAYAAALETALKIKETTGILAEGISTADLLHGPIATVYAGAPVLLIEGGGPADTDLADLRNAARRPRRRASRAAAATRPARDRAGDHRGGPGPAASPRARPRPRRRPRRPRPPQQGHRHDLNKAAGPRPGASGFACRALACTRQARPGRHITGISGVCPVRAVNGTLINSRPVQFPRDLLNPRTALLPRAYVIVL